MGLFRKKKEVEIIEVIDERTDIERNFEEKGQEVGKKTGVFVQKSVNKMNDVKEKIHVDETIEKAKVFASKAATKTKEKINKVKSKTANEKE